MKEIWARLLKKMARLISQIVVLAPSFGRAGFSCGVGIKRNILVEYDYVIAHRGRYLRVMLYSKPATDILPEVYLDESYCHQFHACSKTWVDETRVWYTASSSKGGRMAMIAAGIVHAQGNRLCVTLFLGLFLCKMLLLRRGIIMGTLQPNSLRIV